MITLITYFLFMYFLIQSSFNQIIMKKSNKRISSKPSDAKNHLKFDIKNISSKVKIQPCTVVLNDICIERNKTKITPENLGNGMKIKIFKCKLARCGLKEQFIARDKAISSCSKRVYDCITPSGTRYVDCHTSNVIYLLTCSTCNMQYIGETAQKLNARFTSHRSGIKQPDKYGTCKILSKHFNEGVCKGSNYSVQILEKLTGTGRTERNAIDASMTSHRKKKERITGLSSFGQHILMDLMIE